jgi:hypothetical protein
MVQWNTHAGYKEKLEEMQDLTFDCYRTDPELFSVIDSLVRACEMLTDSSSPDTYVHSQLESACNGLRKYRSERMSNM